MALKLLRAAEDRLKGDSDAVTMIRSVLGVIATARLHDTFALFSGAVRFATRYLDAKSLQHLDAFPKGTTLKYLTHNVTDNGTTRAVAQAFAAKE